MALVAHNTAYHRGDGDDKNEKEVEVVFSNEIHLLQRCALVTFDWVLQNVSATYVVTPRQGIKRAIVPKIATLGLNECEWTGISCNKNGQVSRIRWDRMNGKSLRKLVYWRRRCVN